MKHLKLLLLAFLVAFGAVAGVASAAIDVSAIDTYISSDMTTAFTTVAGVILSFYAVIMAYKVIKRFLR
jgi:hypothetical protein